MSTRYRIPPMVVMNASSLAADAYSAVTALNGCTFFSYTVVWTGTPTGSFQVEACNDYNPVTQSGGNWAMLEGMSVAASGSANFDGIDVPGTGFWYVRLHYVSTGGTGTGTATIACKVS